MKLSVIANSHNDEFYTPLYAIKPICEYIPANSHIWCPFDTKQSLFVKEFTKLGHLVTFGHISTGQDFFKMETPPKINYIISNPPYSLKTEVLLKLFALNKPFAMLLGIVGLFESQKRFQIFKNNEFEIMYMNKRISYFKNYADPKPSLNPPFSSVYLCHQMLPKQIIFKEIIKEN